MLFGGSRVGETSLARARAHAGSGTSQRNGFEFPATFDSAGVLAVPSLQINRPEALRAVRLPVFSRGAVKSMVQVRYVDFAAQYEEERDFISACVEQVFRTGRFV